MAFPFSSFTGSPQRRWWLSLILLVLVASLLVGSVWLYYAKQVEHLDLQLRQLPDSPAIPDKPSQL